MLRRFRINDMNIGFNLHLRTVHSLCAGGCRPSVVFRALGWVSALSRFRLLEMPPQVVQRKKLGQRLEADDVGADQLDGLAVVAVGGGMGEVEGQLGPHLCRGKKGKFPCVHAYHQKVSAAA